MVDADLVPAPARIMMPDGDDRREINLVTRRHALQRIIRLLVSMEKMRLKTGQLQVHRPLQDRPRIGKRTRQPACAKSVCERDSGYSSVRCGKWATANRGRFSNTDATRARQSGCSG